MKVLILYRPNTETETTVLEYVREFKHRTGVDLELVDVNTPYGVELAELYDTLRFPALLAVEDNGEFIQSWPDLEKWPPMNELTFYTKG